MTSVVIILCFTCVSDLLFNVYICNLTSDVAM